MTAEEIFMRLGAALLLGVVIGFERKLVHKEAGMRTYGILSMACATFMLATVTIGQTFGDQQEAWRAITQVLGAVITGIGFLGVGLIFYSKEDHARVGLTSAATLLAVAGLGAACGLGLYTIAFISGSLIFIMLTIGFKLEYWLLRMLGRHDMTEHVNKVN
jgi:putative Mg2+ transporter-C (MgtC) family protein